MPVIVKAGWQVERNQVIEYKRKKKAKNEVKIFSLFMIKFGQVLKFIFIMKR